jgi:hypothetical protein
MGRAPEPTRHGQVDARFVDKFEALEIERLNQRVIVLPRVLDPLGVALRRVERFFCVVTASAAPPGTSLVR